MKVGELAARTGVSVRSLRYYEEIGLLTPRRTSANHRVYTAEHEAIVLQIQELFRAGSCSAVIHDLLPALSDPVRDDQALLTSLSTARTRLESEKHAIDAEIIALQQLGIRLGLAPDTHVRAEDGAHDSPESTQAAAFDHRDRRLR